MLTFPGSVPLFPAAGATLMCRCQRTDGEPLEERWHRASGPTRTFSPSFCQAGECGSGTGGFSLPTFHKYRENTLKERDALLFIQFSTAAIQSNSSFRSDILNGNIMGGYYITVKIFTFIFCSSYSEKLFVSCHHSTVVPEKFKEHNKNTSLNSNTA